MQRVLRIFRGSAMHSIVLRLLCVSVHRVCQCTRGIRARQQGGASHLCWRHVQCCGGLKSQLGRIDGLILHRGRLLAVLL